MDERIDEVRLPVMGIVNNSYKANRQVFYPRDFRPDGIPFVKDRI